MIKNPKIVYYWYDASYVHSGKFIKWVVMRRNSGGKDTNKLGVGIMVKDVYCGKITLRPYTDLYRSYNGARIHKGKIRKPTIEEVRNWIAFLAE